MVSHVHRFILAAALETFVRARVGTGVTGQEVIDGELYWSPGRRGNVPGECKCGSKRTFHPFERTSSFHPDPLGLPAFG
jgi:hypothetical protein